MGLFAYGLLLAQEWQEAKKLKRKARGKKGRNIKEENPGRKGSREGAMKKTIVKGKTEAIKGCAGCGGHRY